MPSNIFLLNIFFGFIFTFFSIPFIKKLGTRFDVFDKSDSRKKNNSNLVRIGGISIFLSFIFSLALNKFFFNTNLNVDLFEDFVIYKLLAASFIIFLLGLADDIKSLNVKLRLLIEVSLGSLMWLWGFRIDNIFFGNLFSSTITLDLPNIVSFFATLIWIVGIINAINWIDGLDGLASTLSSIFFISLFIVGYYFSNYSSALVAAIFIGANLGFLYFNFHPAKILMGDCGSYFLGFNLALLGITSSTVTINNLSFFHLYIPLLIISYPLLDMFIVILKRLFNKSSPFLPDRNHFHYLLIDKGVSNRKTVFLIMLISLFFNSIILLNFGVIWLALILLFILIFFTRFRLFRR